MTYLGSKAKFIKDLCPIFQKIIDENNIQTYIEPFVGGGAIIKNIKCPRRIGYDLSDTLIALQMQARDDFSKIPTEFSEELWNAGKAYKKDDIPLPDGVDKAAVGAMEWFGSYGTKGFPGGAAHDKNGRHYYQERYRNMKKDIELLQGIEFECRDYETIDPTTVKNCFFYIDPPYDGVQPYGWKHKIKPFDYPKFWEWVRQLSINNWVYVSELHAPSDFECVWEKPTKYTTGLDNSCKATEKLFHYKNGL